MSFLLPPSRSHSALRAKPFSSSVAKELKNKVLADSQPFFEAYEKTTEIWQALNIANYKKEGVLNRAAIEIFFNSQKQNFKELLLIKSADEMLELLDKDEDGCLSQEEQIRIFYLIHQKMQKVADDLRKVYLYDLYENLLKDVGKLEIDIIKYLKTLQENKNRRDFEKVFSLSETKEKEFKEIWKGKFQELREEKKISWVVIRDKHLEERKKLEVKVMMESNLHIKPMSSLRSLQLQEKLVAIDGKVLEAKMLRKELESIEASEQKRINSLIEEKNKNKFKKLELRQKGEINHFTAQYEKKRLALLQDYNFEKTRLDKISKIELNEFAKNQKISNSFTEESAKQQNDLLRMKSNSRKRKQVIVHSRSIQNIEKTSVNFSNTTSFPMSAENSVISSRQGFKEMNLTNPSNFQIKLGSFGVKSSFALEKNSKTISKAVNYLTGLEAKKSMPSISSLYSYKLEPLEKAN